MRPDGAGAIPKASYVTNQFCDAKTYHVFIGGRLAYRDRHHLSTPFAESLELERALF
ncbi:hypothetical protein ACWGTO_24430 [Mesorhizobium sp. PL10]